MDQLKDGAKRPSVAFDVVLVGIGIGVGLIALNAWPGGHNWLDAKLFIALGAVSGYGVALLLKLLRLTLPLKAGSLPEWLNAGRENGCEKGNVGAGHAGVQTRGGATGQGRTERDGGGEDPGDR
ncbi:hypothetical protein RQP53_00010 [Paucibacter sp. APW11]|uniref:Uncharacterized protein n=1 Tax=Roseateles aquae TaxID=3077235 RepID=A0ABU3P606_9BURK|nr:hypothetical protein [Paucibacter sp. APW11]MDT8997650.1 hypothetical protein [Paucibacter sp. APW11]